MKFVIAFFLCCPTNAFAVTFMSGGYSLGNYFSKSTERMNERLGNSPALDVPTQFGRTSGVGVDLFFSDKPRKKIFQLAYFGFQESISAVSATTDDEVDAYFSAHQLIVGLGTQLWPPVLGGRGRAGGSGGDSKGRGKGFSLSKKLYVTGFLGGGMFLATHRYKLTAPSNYTDVEYQTQATHWAYGTTLRGSYLLFPGLELVSDLAFFATRKKSATYKLSAYTIGQQDLRYRPELARLNELTDSPYYIIRVALGISFNLSPN